MWYDLQWLYDVHGVLPSTQSDYVSFEYQETGFVSVYYYMHGGLTLRIT